LDRGGLKKRGKKNLLRARRGGRWVGKKKKGKKLNSFGKQITGNKGKVNGRSPANFGERLDGKRHNFGPTKGQKWGMSQKGGAKRKRKKRGREPRKGE